MTGGWTNPITIIFGTSAVIVIGLWSLHQGHRPDPLVNLRTAAIPQVLLTNVASVLVGFTMYAMNLLVPPVMQLPTSLGYGLGQTMVAMGLWMIPMGMGMLAVTNLGPGLSRTRSPRFTLVVCGLITAAGYGIVLLTLATIGARMPGSAREGRIIITLILFSLAAGITGAGVALALGAVPALILASVPITETAAANGLNALTRSLGASTAAAVLGVLLATSASSTTSGVPSLAGYLFGLGLTVLIALLATGVAAVIPHQRQDHTSSPRRTASAPPSQ